MMDNKCVEKNSNKDDVKKNVFSIIDSVKGGCGKTTLALTLSLLFAGNDESKNGEKEYSDTTLLDVDQMGSGLLKQLVNYKLEELRPLKEENRLKNAEYIKKLAVVYLDRAALEPRNTDMKKLLTCLAPNDTYQDISQESSAGISEGAETTSTEKKSISKKKLINVAFTSPFWHNRMEHRSLYGSELKKDLYISGLKRIITQLIEEEGITAQRFQVFDMPPGVDFFTTSLLDFFLRYKKEYDPTRLKNSTINYFLVSTPDFSQLRGTVDYLEWQLENGSMKLKNPDNIFIVINNNLNIQDDEAGFSQIGNETDGSGRSSFQNRMLPTLEAIWKRMGDRQLNLYLCNYCYNHGYLNACVHDGLLSGEWLLKPEQAVTSCIKIGSSEPKRNFVEIIQQMR